MQQSKPETATEDTFVAARWISDDTIELVQKGHLTKAVIEKLLSELKLTTLRKKARFVISETNDVTNMDMDMRGPGDQIIKHLKEIGVEKIVLIARSAVVRVLASTLCLASGVSAKLVPTRAEAEALIEKLRAKSVS